MKRKYLGEYLGTLMLLTAVVGSGIMGEQLAPHQDGLVLLVNSLATGFGLFVIISIFQPISGAHLNPVVSLLEFSEGRLSKVDLVGYVFSQVFGGVSGVLLTHFQFQKEFIQVSSNVRFGPNLWVSEVIATAGLILSIRTVSRHSPRLVPVVVASFIAGAYWFTSSTSFANPAVTFSRMFTNTFTGIEPSGVLPFVIAQLVGAYGGFKISKIFETEKS